MHYLIEPIKMGEETLGLFVVVSLPAKQYEEINQPLFRELLM